MARGWTPTDDEVNKAVGVLEAAYRGWVSDLVESILFDFFNEDIDRDEVVERIDERTDSGLVYTHDQWTTLFASKNTDEAWDEMRDMGYGEARESPVAPWAVTTFRHDVNTDFWQDALAEPINDDLDMNDRLQWLIENYSKGPEIPIGPKGTITAYLIGNVNDVGFGWLWLYRDEEGDYEKHEFIAAGADESALKVLLDMILENGGDPHTPGVRDFIRKMRSAPRQE